MSELLLNMETALTPNVTRKERRQHVTVSKRNPKSSCPLRLARVLAIPLAQLSRYQRAAAGYPTIEQLIALRLTMTPDDAHTSDHLIGICGCANKWEAVLQAPSMRDLARTLPDAPTPLVGTERVRHYLEHARAKSTFAGLEARWKLVRTFCVRVGASPLPLSPLATCQLFADMADAGYSALYIRQVASTISVAHRLADLRSPMEDAAPRRVLRGIGRALGYATPNAKAALFSDELLAMAPAMLTRGIKGEQEWVIIVTMFHTTFRRANIRDLNIEDVVFAPNLADAVQVQVTARRSKTDQLGHGHTVKLAALRRKSLLCPVRSLQHWVTILLTAGFTRGPLFRHFEGPTQLGDARISDRTIARIVQKYVSQLHLNPQRYGAQSVRAGFITEALMKGIDEARLADRTGHRELNSLRRYYRPGLRDAALSEEVIGDLKHGGRAADRQP